MAYENPGTAPSAGHTEAQLLILRRGGAPLSRFFFLSHLHFPFILFFFSKIVSRFGGLRKAGVLNSTPGEDGQGEGFAPCFAALPATQAVFSTAPFLSRSPAFLLLLAQ